MELPTKQGSKDKVNYFVCTLGQAEPFSPKRPHTFTVNDFLDEQHLRVPDLPAVGFPTPQEAGKWTAQVLSKCLDQPCHLDRSMVGSLLGDQFFVEQSLLVRTSISSKFQAAIRQNVFYFLSAPYLESCPAYADRRVLTIAIAFADLRQKTIEKAHCIRGQINDESNAPKNAALLCSSSDEFLLAWLGLMRLGYSVLLIAYDNRPNGNPLKLIWISS